MNARQMSQSNEYTVKRVEEDSFELWFDEECLATLTRAEAWPVMIGRIHPQTFLEEQANEPAADQNGGAGGE
jgi:hypothetical protein